jgi:hypothetical protein
MHPIRWSIHSDYACQGRCNRMGDEASIKYGVNFGAFSLCCISEAERFLSALVFYALPY